MKSNIKLLVLCGPSGSGKTFLEKTLITKYPNMFKKMTQVTTRNIRPGETYNDPYIFISDSFYEKLKPLLIGKLGIYKNSHFKDKYGTLADFKCDDKISTIILAEEGILDLKLELLKGEIGINSNQVVVIYLDLSKETIEENLSIRNRSLEFIAEERNLKKYADIVLEPIDTAKYVDIEQVIDCITSL
jgi:guanylate kinase